MRWESAGKPVEGWIWPAPTKSGHVEPSSLKKQHRKALSSRQGAALRALQLAPHVSNTAGRVRMRCLDPGTNRWAQFDCDFRRYVHPSENAVLDAVERHGWAQNWAQSRIARSRRKALYAASAFNRRGLIGRGERI